jgi:hypothetical protein
VILSGMGSDGTLGLRAIKEKAGVVLVQEPATAKFDSMPRSAIDAGLADIVAPADELPGKILAYLQRTPLIARTELGAGRQDAERPGKGGHPAARPHRPRLFFLQTEHALSPDRAPHGHSPDRKMPAYVRYLQENSQELDLLFKELLIGVTNFFRDPAAWEQLREPRPFRRCSRAARPARRCARGCPAAPPGRKPIPWPSCSRRRSKRLKPRGKVFDSNLRHRPGPGRD